MGGAGGRDDVKPGRERRPADGGPVGRVIAGWPGVLRFWWRSICCPGMLGRRYSEDRPGGRYRPVPIQDRPLALVVAWTITAHRAGAVLSRDVLAAYGPAGTAGIRVVPHLPAPCHARSVRDRESAGGL
jgi:hypothetical protein